MLPILEEMKLNEERILKCMAYVLATILAMLFLVSCGSYHKTIDTTEIKHDTCEVKTDITRLTAQKASMDTTRTETGETIVTEIRYFEPIVTDSGVVITDAIASVRRTEHRNQVVQSGITENTATDSLVQRKDSVRITSTFTTQKKGTDLNVSGILSLISILSIILLILVLINKL